MKQHDILRRFVFEALGMRGAWVDLRQSFQAAKQHQASNPVALELLGETLAAVVLLSATIKFRGSLILQAQGNSDLKTLVAQATHDRQVRGLIRGKIGNTHGSLTQLFGEGIMILTIKPEGAEPYQGVVPLIGANIAEALQTYFRQSEQLPTRLWLFANDSQAVGLLLQALPGTDERHAEDWARIEILANTVTAKELMTLDCEDMLFRLFHEEAVTVFEPETVNFVCGCSVQKIEQTLFTLGREELESILMERPEIEVDCEFCGRHYVFDRVDVERLLLSGVANTSVVQH